MDTHDQETKTREPCDSGPLREQYTETAMIEMHQTQLLKTNQSHHLPKQSTSSPDEE